MSIITANDLRSPFQNRSNAREAAPIFSLLFSIALDLLTTNLKYKWVVVVGRGVADTRISLTEYNLSLNADVLLHSFIH